MITTGSELRTQAGVRILYSDAPRELENLGKYFSTLEGAWHSCQALDYWRETGLPHERLLRHYLDDIADENPYRLQLDVITAGIINRLEARRQANDLSSPGRRLLGQLYEEQGDRSTRREELRLRSEIVEW